MNSTSSPGPVMEVFGRIGFEIHKMKPLLPTYLHLLASATFPIIIAAHASLRRPHSAAPAKKSRTRKTVEDEDNEEEKSSKVESLTISDAILFPILAGCMLTALYLIIKWLKDPAILNKILGYYFSWVGLFFTGRYAKDVLYFVRSWFFPIQYSQNGLLYKVHSDNYFVAVTGDGTRHKQASVLPGYLNKLPLPARLNSALWKLRQALHYKITCVFSLRKPLTQGKASFNLTCLDVAAAIISLGLGVYQNLFSGGKLPWYLTNLVGTSFCYTSLQLMTPGTAGIGSLLLSLLFFYDIYMVFYTPMMVTVATKLDIPIKLLFPRPRQVLPEPVGALPGSQEMQDYLESLAKKQAMAMLGLGDIVIPGIMIAFALRFDLYLFYLNKKSGGTTRNRRSAEGSREEEEEQDTRSAYSAARGSWAERFYTSSSLWSPALKAKAFSRPYFIATICGYLAGMVATLLVMQIWNHAQPALLYLVPGVLISMWSMALWRGEIKVLWAYDENEEEKAKEEKGAAAKKGNKESGKTKEQEDKTDTAKGKSKLSSEDETKSESANDTANDQANADDDSISNSIFSFHICIPNDTPSEAATATAEDNVDTHGSRTPPKKQLKDKNESDTSPSPASSTSCTPQLISEEEADESDSVSEDVVVTENETLLVSTKDDSDGAQAVKRRRRV